MKDIERTAGRASHPLLSALISVFLTTQQFTACTRPESEETVPDTVETAPVSHGETTVYVPAELTSTVDSAVAAATCSPPVEREWYEPDHDQQMFLESGVQWGTTEADISRRLGPPVRTVVDTTQNIHTGEPDELRQMHYDGLEFHIYRVLALEREIIYRVDVEDDRYIFAFGFGVGTPWQQVRECLGVPSGVADSTYQYSVGEAEELITFWVARGVIQRIRWEYYID